jgi:hypothetical protein
MRLIYHNIRWPQPLKRVGCVPVPDAAVATDIMKNTETQLAE